MKLNLKRIAKSDTYTIGQLYIDGDYFCDTLEDKDRGLTSEMSNDEIANIKVAGETAIPSGTYKVSLDVVSKRYGNSQFMKQYANGSRVPRLIGVRGFDGILIHTGNSDKDCAGCILVGRNTLKGRLTASKDTFRELYPLLQASKDDLSILIE